jgi:nucleotide-binding universal stress UspA family protein
MYDHILIAIDPESKKTWERALPEAVKLALTHSATLHVMTVVPDYGSSLVASFFPKNYEKKALEHAKRTLHEVAEPLLPEDLPHQFITAHGRIHDEICRVAEELKADLIVMASHKPSPSDRIIAPTAQQVLLHAPVSVLVVR